MRVLALASLKGGTGKTTLSGHLAVQAQRAGAGPVTLLDIDPHGSLSDWSRARETVDPGFVTTSVARLTADLDMLRQQGCRLAVLDTPPALAMVIQFAVSAAELVVVPTRPGPHDLHAVGATVDLCDRAGKPLLFVLNAATEAETSAEAVIALSKHGTVAPTTVHHHPDFSATMVDGGTVVERDPTAVPAVEIGALWEHVCDRLERNFRRTVFAVPAAHGFGVRQPGGFGRRIAG